jgi:hypothetical protein
MSPHPVIIRTLQATATAFVLNNFMVIAHPLIRSVESESTVRLPAASIPQRLVQAPDQALAKLGVMA